MKKILAALAALVVAAGISLPLALGGGASRPTPEQYIQSLVPTTTLHWQKVSGAEVAKYPADALTFIVGPKTVEIVVSGSALAVLSHTDFNHSTAVIAKFLIHYTGYANEFGGIIGIVFQGYTVTPVHGVSYGVLVGA